MRKHPLLLALVLYCITTSFSLAAENRLPQSILDNGFTDATIVLFEPDIELQRILSSGRAETRADWSQDGQQHSRHWISTFFRDSGQKLAENTLSEESTDKRLKQVLALHRAVGYSIMGNALLPLPTKKDQFEWSIGDGAKQLGASSNADYGLFMFYRRGYTSAGRVAVAVAAALLFGAAVQATYEIGFASLVDFKTGNIVWFNQIQSSRGNLRDPENAQYTIAALLEDFPGLVLPEPKNIESSGTGT